MDMLSCHSEELDRLKEEFGITAVNLEELNRRAVIEKEIRKAAVMSNIPVLMPCDPVIPTKNHVKSPEQTAKQVYKRRKKSKNRKTHRRK